MKNEPGYLARHRNGVLKKRAETLWQGLARCQLCPRECRVNRLEGETGVCGASAELKIYSFSAHFGEEAPLVGYGGSGTIFLSYCNLRCVFCFNFDISHLGEGTVYSIEQFATMMLKLQQMGCHNINLVTPTHYSPHILRALDLAAARGLQIPLVYNTSGWEKTEILRQLDGVVDIYLADFKYTQSEISAKYSEGAASYPEITKAALKEMHRQVGIARPATDGLMYRGLMIRHLVMPNDVSGSKAALAWIAHELSPETYVNLMSQYRPAYQAFAYPEIARSISRQEYREVLECAKELGMTNVEIQGRVF